MKKVYSFLALLLAVIGGVLPASAQSVQTITDTTRVKALAELKEGDKVLFYNAGRKVFVMEDASNGDKMYVRAFNLNSMNGMSYAFTVENLTVNANGTVSARFQANSGNYIPALTAGGQATTAAEGETFTISTSVNGEGWWNILGSNGQYFNGNRPETTADDPNAGFFVGWNTAAPDAGASAPSNSDYVIYTVTTADVDAITITFDVTFFDANGNQVDQTTTEVEAAAGDSVSIPTFDFWAFDRANSDMADLVSSTGKVLVDPDNDVLYLSYKPGTDPFEATTIVDGAFAPTTKWYTMTLSGKYVVMTDENVDEGRVTLQSSAPSLPYADNYLWTFVGNPVSGYTVYNRKAGATRGLQAAEVSSGSLIVAGAAEGTPTAFQLLKNGAGYSFKSLDTENACWNDFQGDAGQNVLTWWVDATSATDNGSRIVFAAVDVNKQYFNVPVRRVDDYGTAIDTVVVDVEQGTRLILPATPSGYTLATTEYDNYVPTSSDMVTVLYNKHRQIVFNMLLQGSNEVLGRDTIYVAKDSLYQVSQPVGFYRMVTTGVDSLRAHSDTIVTLYFVAAMPFEATTIVDGMFAPTTKWYRMTLSGYYVRAQGTDLATRPLTTEAYEDMDDYLWAFVGDTVSGYTIYNRLIGASAGLYSDATGGENAIGSIVFYPYFSATPAKYRLAPNGSGFSFSLIGGENVVINRFGGADGDGTMAYWVSSYAHTDLGSRLQFEEVGIVAEGIDSVTAGKADNTVYDLSGRRVANPGRGLYIVGGKKVFIK